MMKLRSSRGFQSFTVQLPSHLLIIMGTRRIEPKVRYGCVGAHGKALHASENGKTSHLLLTHFHVIFLTSPLIYLQDLESMKGLASKAKSKLFDFARDMQTRYG